MQEMNISELRQICTLLINYIEKEGYNIIKFDPSDALYQKIWHDSRNFGEVPEITVGDLDNDIEDLKKLINPSSDYVPCGLHLEKLGAILTTLGAVMDGR